MQLKDPFSIYDFLGYLFPGLLFCILIKIGYYIEPPVHASTFFYEASTVAFSWKEVIPFIVIAYVAGHFVSYFSSLTVEPFLVWSYGYPSDFLLDKSYKRNYFSKNDQVGKGLSRLWKIVVALILLPIVLSSLIFGRLLRFRFYVLKPLDDELCKAIKEKTKGLMDMLSINYEDERYDYHRIIMHYCYENYNNHISKYNNYVALYGFLRAITLLCDWFFWYCCYSGIKTIDLKLSWRCIDIKAILFILFILVITYIFYLGFVKFYRRFTLENYMSIVQDSKIKVPQNNKFTGKTTH